MEKKELLDLIDQDSSFMKAFLDEYRQDGVNFGAEDRLMSLFGVSGFSWLVSFLLSV